MNKSSSRIFQYFGIFLLSLLIGYLVFSFADRDRNIEQAENIKEVENVEQAAELKQAADINIVGMWQSEPILGQLGLGQSSYTFNADGSFTKKTDYLRFCKDVQELPLHNCEYHWMFSNGKYAVKNGVITLHIKERKTEHLGKGQTKPEIRIHSDRPLPGVEYIAKLDAGKLFMTSVKSNETVVFKPINND